MANGHGGARQGAGRPEGAVSRATREAIERAKLTGELPHEFLLRVSRGDPIDGEKPSLQMRVDAAKAAAPYFAAKLSVTELDIYDPDDLRNWTEEELKQGLAEDKKVIRMFSRSQSSRRHIAARIKKRGGKT